MKLIIKIFSSLITTAVLLLLYAIFAAVATFIENDFGTSASKYLVYNSWYFNILHILLVSNMIVVFFEHKMYEIKKLTIFIFHFAFIIIILGASITRFISYEGVMHIREGQTSNSILTYTTHIEIEISKDSLLYKSNIPVNFNKFSGNNFNKQIKFDNREFNFELINYVPNAVENIISETEGIPIVLFSYFQDKIRKDFIIKYGESKVVDGQKFTFGLMPLNDAFNIDLINDTLFFISGVDVIISDMIKDTLKSEEKAKLLERKIYNWGNNTLILKKLYPHARTSLYSSKEKTLSALIFNINSQNKNKELIVYGDGAYKSESKQINIDNYNISVYYGAKEIELPFSLTLNDFVLKRYPGSSSPAAYESFVQLTDTSTLINKEHKIFMNNVLEYGGYRFFQSSFDNDEHGTVLSVNHDYWGTTFTYLGYFLLTFGMVLSIFNKNSRFKFLAQKIKKIDMNKNLLIVVALFFSFQSGLNAQEIVKYPIIEKSHAEKFGNLLIQDRGGRMKPVNTFTNELLRKLTRRSNFNNLNSDQVYLSMLLKPEIWATVPLIKIKHPELLKRFKNDNGLVSISEMFDRKGNYVIKMDVNKAYEKGAGKQDMYDKEIIKLDERVNILYSALSGNMLNIFPDKEDENNKWYNINNIKHDSVTIHTIYNQYVRELNCAANNDSLKKADLALQKIFDYQKQNGHRVYIDENKIKAEVFYNNAAIFRHLFEFYFIIGLFYIVYLILIIVFPKLSFKFIDIPVRFSIYIAFIFQTFGLALRWYISGHAPWSNGYESMIYISWVTLLAGVVFSNKNRIALAATSVLAGIVLLIAHLSWIDPEITNLVPVLNSYWLTIHVAVIIASYGFLGLGAILGFVNLILMVIKTKENYKRIDGNIEQLSDINEMSLILGLYLLAIGTFLGGIWANESWGRYWGWDPKETWALITVVIYSIVVHLRFIPKLKGIFTFNFLSIISFGAVIMTYFGVNYYLSGLHSYASGDPVPIPSSVYYTLIVILIISNIAYIRNKKIFEIGIENT
ncbi:MAG: cytochrome c biogenesis protein CcsA [Bacteroidales bacterium]|nr:cytochrome c biogenesis protein CcsA [Bacteroidales bacterium]